MLSVFCPASFGVLFCSVVPGCRYTPLTIGLCVVSGARLLTIGVFECKIAHRQLWQYYVCYIRSGAIRCTLIMMLYLFRMCASAGYTLCFGRTSM